MILAHDLGTSGNKASLFYENGKLAGSTKYSYATNYVKEGWIEQDPGQWWQAIIHSTQELFDKYSISNEDIKVVSFSGMMMGVVAVDAHFNPLHPSIIWADMRAENEVAEALSKMNEHDFYKLSGNRLSPSYSAAKIAWLKRNKPDIYERAYKFLQTKDFIVGKLTGQFVTDYSDASGTNLMDITSKEWSSRLLDLWGVDRDKLPDIYPSTHIAGNVTKETASLTGLKQGTPVVVGGADGACAALGAGVVNEGDMFNYIGSSSWIAGASNTPLFDEQMRTFNFVHVDHSKFLPIGTMQTAGGALDWIKNMLYDLYQKNGNLTDTEIYNLLNDDIEEISAGSDGVLFLPYLMGERSPIWNSKARGAFVGLKINHDRKYISRSVMEGISANLRAILESLQENGLVSDEIWLFGGGAKMSSWRQMLADFYKKPVKIPFILDETTSMGAAVLGAVGIGIHKDLTVAKEWCTHDKTYYPREDVQPVYDDLFHLFLTLYRHLEPHYSKQGQRRK